MSYALCFTLILYWYSGGKFYRKILFLKWWACWCRAWLLVLSCFPVLLPELHNWAILCPAGENLVHHKTEKYAHYKTEVGNISNIKINLLTLNLTFYICCIWQKPLSRATFVYLLYTNEQLSKLRTLLKGLAVAAWTHDLLINSSIDLPLSYHRFYTGENMVNIANFLFLFHLKNPRFFKWSRTFGYILVYALP